MVEPASPPGFGIRFERRPGNEIQVRIVDPKSGEIVREIPTDQRLKFYDAYGGFLASTLGISLDIVA